MKVFGKQYKIGDYFGVIPSIVAAIAIHYMVGGITPLPNSFLAAAYILPIILYVTKSRFQIKPLWLIFLVYLPITIVIGNPAPVFKSTERWLLFAVLYIAMSPMIQSDYARKFRSQCLNMTLVLCILLTVGSFIGYFFGVNLFSYEYAVDYVGKAGLFPGLTRQSMFLGPISSISAIVLFYKAMRTRKIVYWCLFIVAIGTVFLASSRVAVGAVVVGIIVTLYYISVSKSQFFKRAVIIVVLACCSFPFWKGATDALMDKFTMHEDSEEMFDSRSVKFKARIDEFTESPVTGIGFAAIDPKGIDNYNHRTGTIEPGSSWLGVLSMTGVIGFILFVILYAEAYINSLGNMRYAWITGILAFFIVHMFAEGYVFAGGSPTAFILWLTIGRAFDIKYN